MANEDSPEGEKVGKEEVIRIFEAIAKGVYRGKFDNEEVVVKEISLFEVENVRELQYLRQLDHKNVVKYRYNDKDKRFLYIVLEKCDFTLAQFVCDDDKKKDLHPLDVLRQVTEGMVYLHEDKNILHRDLKPSNILILFRDKRWVAKITDFGISKALQQNQTRVTQSVVKGTSGYMAPEQMKGEKIGKHTDIFSLGLIFHFVMSEGKHPFGKDTLEAEQNMCNESVLPNMDAIQEKYKDDAGTLIALMISRQIKDRLTIKEVEAHHLFWDAQQKLLFIGTVSDYIISSKELFGRMQPVFEEKAEEIAGNWRQKLHEISPRIGKVFDEMKNKNQGDGVCDLMRNIRNLTHHYDGKNLEEEMGSRNEGVYQFFREHFPKLFNYAYDIMRHYKDESRFVNYYLLKKQEHLCEETQGIKSAIVSSSATHSNDVSTPDAMDVDSGEMVTEQNDVLAVTTVDLAQRTCPVSNIKAEKETRPSSVPGTGLTQEMKEISFGKIESESKLLVQKDEKELMQQAQEGESSSIASTSGSAKTERSSQGSDLTSEVDSTSLPTNTDKNKLVLREYQKELAEQALRGENSLIVAPTGSGKTAVLTKVIEHHLRIIGETGRVMFVVPKTALAGQQFRYLECHLEGFNINYMIGQNVESAPVGQRILDNQVTVLTPQVLINELNKEQRYVTFNDLSMLVFDECHNATKKHPYRELMDMLLDYEDETSKARLIQVIGVTASPGVGKAKDRIKVKDKLVELLANLNVISAPVTVEKNLEELSHHHRKIKESFLQVHTEQIFAHEVEGITVETERKIIRLLQENGVTSRDPPQEKGAQSYSNWVEDLNGIARSSVQDGEQSRLIISYAAYLKFYHYVLQMKDLLPNALEQAQKKVTFLTEGPEYEEMERTVQGLKETKNSGLSRTILESGLVSQ